jgi:hypothetical protein
MIICNPLPKSGRGNKDIRESVPLMVATTGVSSDRHRPAVTSMRPLSARPISMAMRVMRLSVMLYTKLPSPSEPTAPAGTVSASGRLFISSETSAHMPG